MSKEKQFVDDPNMVTTSPIPVDHTNNLHKVIDDFFSSVIPSECLEVNSLLLNAYLGKEGEYTHAHLQEVVYLVTAQSKFLIKLSEHWALYTRFVLLSGVPLTVPSTEPTVP